MLPKVSISEEPSMCNRETDKFGELAAKCIGQVQKRLTPEETDKLILEYQSGKTLVELGEEFGCHSTTASRILAQNGIEKPPRTDDRAEEIIRSHQAGKSVRAIAKEIGADHATISRILKEHGIAVNKRRAQAKVEATKVARMYEEMHTTKEIAQHFGVSPKAILACLREQGVKIRNRWDYAER